MLWFEGPAMPLGVIKIRFDPEIYKNGPIRSHFIAFEQSSEIINNILTSPQIEFSSYGICSWVTWEPSIQKGPKLSIIGPYIEPGKSY